MTHGRTDKPLVWLHGEIKTPPFTELARVEAGVLLRRLQRGELLGLPHSRPMPAIGQRCHELRIPDKTKSWRIFYHTTPDAIVLLEVLQKQTQQTPLAVIRTCQQRLKLYLSIRQTNSLMKAAKKSRLEKAGFRVGSTAEFLNLSPEETTLVNMRLSLAGAVRGRRARLGFSQSELARRLGSSQSRVAKIEAGESNVSFDLLVRAMLATGAKPREVGQAIAAGK